MRLISDKLVRACLGLALGLLVLLATSSPAEAYPQFQFTSGNSRCNLCHYAPSGGGLLTAYGRDESADTLSTWGGDGRWLYGAYEEPEWLQLGLDMRGAVLLKDQVGDPEWKAFPMQGDTYARLAFSERWSGYLSLGPRAQVREAAPVYKRFGAREFYGMWNDSDSGYYARAGRFLTPFGLRSQDHTWYVRRDAGLYTWDETLTITGGRVRPDWEAHLSLFAPVPSVLQSGGSQDVGAAGYYERRLGDATSVAVQGRAGFSEEHARVLVGAWGKHYVESLNLLLSAELDAGHENFSDAASPSRLQWISYLGLSYLPTKGVMVTLSHERYDQDLEVKATARDAASLALQFFPWAKWELMFVGKAERHGTNARRTSLAMLQLHYYL